MSTAHPAEDQQLQAMTRELATFVVTQYRQVNPSLVLDALLSAYLNVAHSAGRLGEVPAGVAAILSHPAVLDAMGQPATHKSIH